MKKYLVFCVAAMGLLVTGCSRNQYIVELTPRGKVVERKLTFYREKGTDTNGVPNYESFPQDELATIRKLYPLGSIAKDGERRTAVGPFADTMPSDVGGAGVYTNVSTGLGSAGFYMERFRGDDDLAARIAKRSKAADQLADLVIGWSRQEFGRERNYKELRRFLDTEFRRDLKNLSFYTWMVQASMVTKSDKPEEFGVRFGQYLVERGYLKIEDLPGLFRIMENWSEQPVMVILQRFVAEKLGVPKSGPMPVSVARLADPAKTVKSWEKYLETTDRYQAEMRKWGKEKLIREMGVAQERITNFLTFWGRTNGPAGTSPKPDKPEPSQVVQELAMELLDFNWANTDDHVTVRLSLPSAPGRTNGKWDEARKQVLWESDLETGTNNVSLPPFCYASWSEANEPFQKEHFGNVVLRGEELTQYCLWRGGLNAKLAGEWEMFVSDLRPGEELKKKLDTFRFSDELPAVGPNQQGGQSDLPRGLIKDGLEEKMKGGGK